MRSVPEREPPNHELALPNVKPGEDSWAHGHDRDRLACSVLRHLVLRSASAAEDRRASKRLDARVDL
jgi:hypothetical protein